MLHSLCLLFCCPRPGYDLLGDVSRKVSVHVEPIAHREPNDDGNISPTMDGNAVHWFPPFSTVFRPTRSSPLRPPYAGDSDSDWAEELPWGLRGRKRLRMTGCGVDPLTCHFGGNGTSGRFGLFRSPIMRRGGPSLDCHAMWLAELCRRDLNSTRRKRG